MIGNAGTLGRPGRPNAHLASGAVSTSPDPTAPKPATEVTAAANAAVAAALPLDDPGDFDLATRGKLADPALRQIPGALGLPVWNHDAWAFLEDDPPPTVNPSLWRQARLNTVAGLFEVAEGFYQVRGLDLSNVTFVAGDTGWIVVDPLTSTETARAALDLLHAHVPARPVHTVIYTHSHVDHFGGVHGVVDAADVEAGRVQILAPEGFLEAAVSENVVAGTAMTRRASYMYGALLGPGPTGHVDAGLGKGVPLMGGQGLIAPTEELSTTGEERVIDGVRIVFQLTPGTEAPAEMNFHFPDHRVLCMAENCSANLHNLYTPRGAQVRDALAWSKYLNESIEWFVEDTDVMWASHHWPRWGTDEVRAFLEAQRDVYRWIHDQTMRLANHGLTMIEVAEELDLPPSLAHTFGVRGYYGTVNHNAKAVYQRYLGWFDGNPAHLHPHPPVEAAHRYVEYMGGAEAVLERARRSFDEGDFRWVAEVVGHVVFADPDHLEARCLQADAFEQLGYQAESGPWRAFYLTGAQELRHGAPALAGIGGTVNADTAGAMTPEMLLDYLGVRLNGPRADGTELRFTLIVTDRPTAPEGGPEGEVWAVGLVHGALNAVRGRPATEPDAELRCRHAALVKLCLGSATITELEESGDVAVSGRREALEELWSLLDDFDPWWEIVRP